MVVCDAKETLEIDGAGNVLTPEADGIVGIGSGGQYAKAAARALVGVEGWGAERVCRRAMEVAASIDLFSNDRFEVDVMVGEGEGGEGERWGKRGGWGEKEKRGGWGGRGRWGEKEKRGGWKRGKGEVGGEGEKGEMGGKGEMGEKKGKEVGMGEKKRGEDNGEEVKEKGEGGEGRGEGGKDVGSEVAAEERPAGGEEGKKGSVTHEGGKTKRGEETDGEKSGAQGEKARKASPKLAKDAPAADVKPCDSSVKSPKKEKK